MKKNESKSFHLLVRKEGHAAYKEATTELEQHERIMHIEWDKPFTNFRTFFEMIFVLIKNEFRSLHELNWIWFMFWRMIVYNKNGSISTYTAFFSCLHNVDEKEYEPRMRLTNEKSLYLVWLRAQHFWSFFLYLVLQIGPLASSTYHNAYSFKKVTKVIPVKKQFVLLYSALFYRVEVMEHEMSRTQ